jgi:hypothetical protein
MNGRSGLFLNLLLKILKENDVQDPLLGEWLLFGFGMEMGWLRDGSPDFPFGSPDSGEASRRNRGSKEEELAGNRAE